ncbi:MAG TPA: hypothetical protein VGK29_03895 [Paludibaculum sp.]|jgi:hypothetical protein
MACYISTKKNRFYAALESIYGTVAAVTAADRFTGKSLKIQNEQERPKRRDKTGTRTYRGIAGALRARTKYELKTYLYGREVGSAAPRFGALLEAGLGGAPRVQNSGLAVTSIAGLQVTFAQGHGLQAGDAVALAGEIRFVMAMPDAYSVLVNAPWTQGQTAGELTGGAVTYGLAASVPGVSLYDCWSPAAAVQRVLRGAVVDETQIRVSGDFHELTFSGEAADVLDSASFEAGVGGLTEFPQEPALEDLMEEPVPGHLGQAWIGGSPSRVYTLSQARVTVRNHIELRGNDFGTLLPRCIVPGDREVLLDLELYSQDGGVFDELYQAARSRTPVPVMLQLGEQESQLCGVYIPNLIPAVPEFVDEETRLRWRLQGSIAVGTVEDEVYVAFG